MNPSAPAAIVDVDITNFEREVLARSRQVPVLVDFWASWCGPCKSLGPVLEKLAREYSGRLVLAKVDVDKNPELAHAFRIQSVPSVILLVGGRPVDGFVGAQPEAEIRRLLEPHLGGAGAVDVVAEAQALEQAGDREGAIKRLRDHLRDGKQDTPARVALARLLLDAGRADEARKVFDKLSEQDQERDDARAVAARLALAEAAGDLDELRAKVERDPGDLAACIDYGKALFAAGRREEGLEMLLDAARRDLSFQDGAARKALLEAFEALGYEDPLSIEYQKRLSVLLCS